MWGVEWEPPRASDMAWIVPGGREGGGSGSGPYPAWWPLEGACPGLQMDGSDICGSAGLAGPLAAGAPWGFGRWVWSGLRSFSEALPERSFNLLLAGPQAVLERGRGGMVRRAHPAPASGGRCKERTPQQGSWEGRPQPSPRNRSSFLRNQQEDVARGCESSPASDIRPPPLLQLTWQEKGTQNSALHPT